MFFAGKYSTILYMYIYFHCVFSFTWGVLIRALFPRNQQMAAFLCDSFCSLKKYYDYKGTSTAQQFVCSERYYIVEDLFSLKNKNKIVLYLNCDICNGAVCMGCNILYLKRFCLKCESRIYRSNYIKIKNETDF